MSETQKVYSGVTLENIFSLVSRLQGGKDGCSELHTDRTGHQGQGSTHGLHGNGHRQITAPARPGEGISGIEIAAGPHHQRVDRRAEADSRNGLTPTAANPSEVEKLRVSTVPDGKRLHCVADGLRDLGLAGLIDFVCGVEQRLARLAHNQQVVGSSPTPATNQEEEWSDSDTARERYRDQLQKEFRQQPEESPEAEPAPRVIRIDQAREHKSPRQLCRFCQQFPCVCGPFAASAEDAAWWNIIGEDGQGGCLMYVTEQVAEDFRILLFPHENATKRREIL
jgi:hypothetical protein